MCARVYIPLSYVCFDTKKICTCFLQIVFRNRCSSSSFNCTFKYESNANRCLWYGTDNANATTLYWHGCSNDRREYYYTIHCSNSCWYFINNISWKLICTLIKWINKLTFCHKWISERSRIIYTLLLQVQVLYQHLQL